MRLAFITENWKLKVFSLAVSTILFLFVSVESATPVEADFRIEYKTAEGMMIVGDAPTVLHTTLQGPWASFRSFDVNDLRPVIVDLANAGPGTLRHAVETRDVDAPGGMNVVAIRPAEIEVTLDRQVERQVPVQVDITGKAAFGSVLEGTSVDPVRVHVVGPQSAIQKIDFVYTRPIDIEGKLDDVNLEIDLRPPPPPLRIKERRVAVSVAITEEVVTRSFDNLPVSAPEAPSGTKLVPDKLSVKLKGPKKLVDALDAQALTLYVDVLPEYDAGEQSFTKAVKLRGNPERTQWLGSTPEVVVQIPKSKVKKKKVK